MFEIWLKIKSSEDSRGDGFARAQPPGLPDPASHGAGGRPPSPGRTLPAANRAQAGDTPAAPSSPHPAGVTGGLRVGLSEGDWGVGGERAPRPWPGATLGAASRGGQEAHDSREGPVRASPRLGRCPWAFAFAK